jgi:hypothetical protein
LPISAEIGKNKNIFDLAKVRANARGKPQCQFFSGAANGKPAKIPWHFIRFCSLTGQPLKAFAGEKQI